MVPTSSEGVGYVEEVCHSHHCPGPAGPPSARAGLNIFACEPEWGALAREIGGDQVKVFIVTTALQDPHHIQARPSLIARMRRADLLVCTGAELEIGWLPLVLHKAHNGRVMPGQPGHFLAATQVRLLERCLLYTSDAADES